MKIDCISDLHGYYPKLEGGDLLIVAGDLTGRDKRDEYIYFCAWVRHSGYKKIIVIAGNHDNLMQNEPNFFLSNDQVSYLCDSGTEFEGLKIYGSPWTKTFPGINPHCCAFTVDTDEELAEKWEMIPNDTDILITHSPPYGIFDLTSSNETVGSRSLRERSMKISPKLHIFGHIHECGGRILDTVQTKFINASIVNEHYQHVNKPVRVVL